MATDPAIVVNGKSPDRPPDQLTLVVNHLEVSGWEDVAVTLRAEGFPNTFQIAMSSKVPITSTEVVAKAGDPATVLLGDDTVITGFIDRDVTSVGPESHLIQLVGRGKTADLVDCSAKWDSNQLIEGDALDISNKLALPYAIAVRLGDGASAGDKVPATCLNYTETAAAIIQRVAQNAKLLAYEAGDGALLLATVGSTVAASGIVYGENIQSCSVENSMDQRFSEVVCCAQSLDTWSDLAGDDYFYRVPDPNVPRYRNLNIVLEQVADDPVTFTEGKAVWEVARRAGRASVVRAVIDSWRDSAGTLWAPNTLIPVDVPGLRIADKELCLSEVTFRRNNEAGTTAEMMLMPKAAFTPEPISLQPLNAADVIGPDGTP